MRTISLNHGAWVVVAAGEGGGPAQRVAGQEFPASVPGCVHAALVSAGAIEDPGLGDNEKRCQWVGETDWEYRTTVMLDAAAMVQARLDLVCEGLDTIAEVAVNGVAVGGSANVHLPHRFDIRGCARAGANEVVITFRSAMRHIRAEEARLGSRPVNGDWDPYVFIRKAACSFGWDWGPRLATCGISGSLRVEAWSGARLASVRPLTRRVEGDQWRLDAQVEVEWAGSDVDGSGMRLGACLRDGAELDEWSAADVQSGVSTYRLSFDVTAPRLWHPRGSGEPFLHRLDVALYAPDEAWGVADGWEGRVGFRAVALDTRGDGAGTAFTLMVDGEPVFCKGANWIPEGLYAGYADAATIRARVRQAADAGFNMLRVWGGGVYESDAFYDACDELGIMVWQDFMFACAMYPEDAPYPALVEAEARYQIARLTAHACVVLWCGGNECTWAHESWGNAPGERPWKERLGGRTWGGRYYFEMLPRLVAELAPTTPYWPNSPWPGREGLGGNSFDHGDRHTWDRRVEEYTHEVARFVSEFGHQSPANVSTLVEAVGGGSMTLGSAALEHRQRATGGTARHIDEPLSAWFRPARGFAEWHYLGQLMQARVVRTGIEWARVNQPRCMGALMWQLNDCWAGMSWSLIDSAGRAKLAWHAAREACADRLLTIQPFDGRPWLCAVNDGGEAWAARAQVRRVAFDGCVLATVAVERVVPARSAVRVAAVEELVGDGGMACGEVVVADGEGVGRCTWFFGKDVDLAYPAPVIEVSQIGRGVWRVRARSLIRDAAWMVDRAWPGMVAQPQLVTLLPGETVTVSVGPTGTPGGGRDEGAKDVAMLASPAIFYCANNFGRR